MPIGHTLKLDTDTWDLMLDSAGNLQTAMGSYAIAQDVANAVRLFTDDAYYEPERGIPYFVITLGQKVQQSVLNSRVRNIALEVDGVEDVEVSMDELDENRQLTGSIEITTVDGEVVDVDL